MGEQELSAVISKRRGPGSRVQWIQALLGALLFLLVGSAWAVASPPMSAADDDFHLTSIACAQGDGLFCERVDETTVRVPTTIASQPCFIKSSFRGADCLRWNPELVEVDRWNRGGEHIPQPYYWSMSRLLGTDLWVSVVMMRITNVMVASALLFLALALLSGGLRTAFAVAWLVTMTPVGLFHVASTNPSSWATAGIATFWALLLGAIAARKGPPWLRLALVGATALSALIALLGRSDSIIYLGASVVAVSVLRWRVIKRDRWFLPALLVLLVIGLILGGRRIQTALQLIADQSSGAGHIIFDWAPRFHLLEWPLLIFYVFGGPTPLIQPYEIRYTMGVGWDKYAALLSLEFPPIVGIFLFGSAALAVGVGLTRYSRRKIFAVAVMVGTVFVMSFGWMWLSGFAGWPQARYYVGGVLVAVGLALLSSRRRPLPLRKVHVVVIALLTGLGGTAALATVVRATTNGQAVPGNHWSEYESYIQWWWWNISSLPVPHPNVVVLLGGIATILYAVVLSYIAFDSLSKRSNGKSSGVTV